ncbi:MAG TPA: hypothetical protein DDZ80_14005 [Cyanobacteria bacterium UBA8803]|nr:hypothetical protein [Cyanobacteria bacterium UBA8803]
MGRRIRVSLLLLIAVLSLTSVSGAIANASLPASSAVAEGRANPENARSTIVSQNTQRSPWQIVLDIFRRKKRRGGTRGEEFCLVVPAQEVFEIWSDRPLFVWQGTLKTITVSLPDDEWAHDVTEKEQAQKSIVYAGPALQPGQEYFIEGIYETIKDGKIIRDRTDSILFKVMEGPRRQQIAEQLLSLDSQSTTSSAEKLALERARYFAENDLFLDVVREIFSVPTPSPTVTEQISLLLAEFCN